jgi:hypothetical protein
MFSIRLKKDVTVFNENTNKPAVFTRLESMETRVVDQHSLDADPDPKFHLEADPDPYPNWHQNDANTHTDPTPTFIQVEKKDFLYF